uniref:RING-type domain-containing protein n=1 Tax=Trieres chinensis TaxID=1514140 RepID=A0A6U1U8Q6_TRICV|mmetsp:Transcript_20475/g.41463  ORF Transcript_20475/g.41463 Transcript_20475/m.41463 type:complete len:109 (+) Transcript_20475:193-519(+)
MALLETTSENSKTSGNSLSSFLATPIFRASGGGALLDESRMTCLVCLTEQRNSTIVHGGTGHIACCLTCARLLKSRGFSCPVCRLEIDTVIQHFWGDGRESSSAYVYQ